MAIVKCPKCGASYDPALSGGICPHCKGVFIPTNLIIKSPEEDKAKLMRKKMELERELKRMYEERDEELRAKERIWKHEQEDLIEKQERERGKILEKWYKLIAAKQREIRELGV
jgi:NMD protein affecting ribosome stability and mRNA decay